MVVDTLWKNQLSVILVLSRPGRQIHLATSSFVELLVTSILTALEPRDMSSRRYYTVRSHIFCSDFRSLKLFDQVEEMVPAGALAPDEIHLPGVHVDAVFKANSEKTIEQLTLTRPKKTGVPVEKLSAEDADALIRERIVRRAALELKDGMNVNLGIGIPTLASNVCFLLGFVSIFSSISPAILFCFYSVLEGY
jgi:hypothetical protein